MRQNTRTRTRIIRRIAIPAMVMCLMGAAACNRPPDRGQSAPRSSSGVQWAHNPVHPDVPGRTKPCPRAGGLEKSGYPCEPILARQAAEARKTSGGEKTSGAEKANEAQHAGEGQVAGDKK